MTESLKRYLFYLISGLFLLVATFCITTSNLYIFLLPAVFIIALLILFSFDILILALAFITPLAVNLRSSEVHLGISLPSEPLIAILMLMFLLKLLKERTFDTKIMRHPVTIAILINLSWILLTSFTSTLPLVSIKFFIARLWFVSVFYFLCTQVFLKFKNIRLFIWLYIAGLLAVICYTIYIHSLFGFGEKPAHWAMTPFYNDHTAYAAALAMFIPALALFTQDKAYNTNQKLIIGSILLIYLIAIILSYTRAAWISLAIAFAVFMIFWMRVHFTTLLIIGAVAGAFFLLFRTQIIMKLEKNRQDSSSNYSNHIKSITNISTDASNLERINRWKSAIRMFKEKPILGWGPGTYSFKYAPFQHSTEMTIISTNAGNKGNAHSEYIGPLAESGILGMLTFISIIILTLYRGTLLFVRTRSGSYKTLILSLMLGLITYIIHGGLNNFLDTDKASVPFWGFIAALVTLDVYLKEEPLEPAATGK